MQQQRLFPDTAPPTRGAYFAGADYAPARDDARLRGQLADIYGLMKDGLWRTLREIHQTTGHPEASISAQLRHLRKKRFGGHDVQREHLGGGLYRYRIKTHSGASPAGPPAMEGSPRNLSAQSGAEG